MFDLAACYKCYIDPTKTETDCAADCGSGTSINPLTQPTGYLCSECLLASETFQTLVAADQDLVKLCIQKAKEANEDIYNSCKEFFEVYDVTTPVGEIDLPSIFIGRVSHFLAECPGRPIATDGAVCMPYFSYNDIIDIDSADDDHVLDKISVKWTANDKQWPEEV